MVCKTCFYNNFTKSKQLKLIFALLVVEIGYFFAFENPSLESIFIGLGLATAGGTKTISTTSIAGGGLIMAHTTTIGDYAKPAAAVASSEKTGSQGSVQTGLDEADQSNISNGIRLKKITGLTGGATIDKIQLNIVDSTGNVRIYAYDDLSNAPNNLLDESGTLALGGTGLQNYAFPDASRVPSDGIVWIGWQFSSGTASLRKATASVTLQFKLHTFGNSAPDPWDGATDGGQADWLLHLFTTPSNLDDDAVDDATGTHWESNAEVNPKIYVDVSSSKNICGIAIYLHANTTETEFKIRVSTDATFIDSETVRKITMSKLTAGTWEFIRCNITSGRYIELFGSSGSSLVFAVGEIKIYSVTDAVMNGSHGHLGIDTADTAIGLDGT